jgi:hypothetical protein
MPISEAPLSEAPRSEASSGSGALLSEMPTPRGAILLFCLVQEGHRVLGRNKQSVPGRASSRRRQRGVPPIALHQIHMKTQPLKGFGGSIWVIDFFILVFFTGT